MASPPRSPKMPIALLPTSLTTLFRPSQPQPHPQSSPSKHRTRLRHSLLPLLLALLTTPLLLLALLTGTALPTSRLSHPSLPYPTLPRCKNALIFTGARQGSTWFIDSVERCRYSTKRSDGPGRAFADNVFKKTELWKHFGEKEHQGGPMGVDDVLRYITSNTSVKIFPSVFWRKRPQITEILHRRFQYRLTVILLRRDVEATWQSWRTAEATDVWNGAANKVTSAVNETEHRFFVESRARYDAGVEDFLNKLHVEYDIIDYDEAKKMSDIVAKKNRCYVRNCNFEEGNRTRAVAVGRDLQYQVESIDRGEEAGRRRRR